MDNASNGPSGPSGLTYSSHLVQCRGGSTRGASISMNDRCHRARFRPITSLLDGGHRHLAARVEVVSFPLDKPKHSVPRQQHPVPGLNREGADPVSPPCETICRCGSQQWDRDTCTAHVKRSQLVIYREPWRHVPYLDCVSICTDRGMGICHRCVPSQFVCLSPHPVQTP